MDCHFFISPLVEDKFCVQGFVILQFTTSFARFSNQRLKNTKGKYKKKEFQPGP